MMTRTVSSLVALLIAAPALAQGAAPVLAPVAGGTGTSTAPSGAQVPLGTSGGTYAPRTIYGDCGIATNGQIVCGETNGVPFGALATENQVALPGQVTGVMNAANGGTGTALGVGGTTYTAVGGSTASSDASRFGKYLNLKDDFGAYGDNVTSNYLVTTTASNCTISFAANGTFPAPVFTAGDVTSPAKPIEIAGAGAAGGLLSTTISTVLTSTSITVPVCPSTSLAGVAETVVRGHDDTTFIQNAFTASAVTPVFVPPGTYRYTAPLTLPQDGIVFGHLNNPYYYYPNGTGAYTSSLPSNLLAADGFSGSWASATASITLGGYNRLENVGNDISAVTTGLENIYTQQRFNEIIHNYLKGGTVGVIAAFLSVTPPTPQDVGTVIRENDISASGADAMTPTACIAGIEIQSASDILIQNNWVHSCKAGAALDLSAGDLVLASGNILENSKFGLELFGNARNSSFLGNKLENDTQAGIVFSDFTGSVTLTANTFFQNQYNYQVTGTTGNTGSFTSSANTYSTSSLTLYQLWMDNAPTTWTGSAQIYELWPVQASGWIVSATGGAGPNAAVVALFQPGMLLTPNNLVPYTSDIDASIGKISPGSEYVDIFGFRRQLITGSHPTAAGTCTIASIGGDYQAGTFRDSGGCGPGGTVILTLGTVTPSQRGFHCTTNNQTTPANVMNQTGFTTTTVTFTGTMLNNDLISFGCTPFS
jgi:hypothetical protein